MNRFYPNIIACMAVMAATFVITHADSGTALPPQGGCGKSGSRDPEPCRLYMGLFALRAAAGPGEFLAVGKSIAAADTSGRNYNTFLAMAFDGPTDMGKMVIYFLLHDRQGLRNLQRIHIRPAQEIDHLPSKGLVLFPQALFFHPDGVFLFLPCRVFLDLCQYF